MARIPQISVQGWTAEGPAYTIHRTLAGWRHRRERRKGNSLNANELVGPHELLENGPQLPVDVGAAFMVFAMDEIEVYAFRAAHVYEVTLLVDGDAMNVLVDARGDEDRLEEYGPDLSLLEWRAVDSLQFEPVIESALTAADNVSDGVESQESITTLTGAQVEQSPYEDEAARDAAYAAYAAAANELFPDAATDGEEASTGDHDFDGTIADFVELAEAMTDKELGAYGMNDSRKGIHEAADRELARRVNASIGDDEDAVGGADDLESSDEEE